MTTTSDQTTATDVAVEPHYEKSAVAVLTKYEQARTALAQCVSVDEAKSIRDKAEALRAYGQQSNDFELEIWAAEIKTRAMRCIGEISNQLQKAKRGGSKNGKRGGGIVLPPSGSTKANMLKAAGLSLQTAHRCEKIAAMPIKAFEAIIDEKKAKHEPVTVNNLIREVAKAMKKQASAQPKIEAERVNDRQSEEGHSVLDVGDRQANLAIDCLKEIPMDDPSRERGMQAVRDWIDANLDLPS